MIMKQNPKTITETEADLLLAWFCKNQVTPHGKFRALRNRLICMIMLDAGLRVSEVSKLRLRNIMFNGTVSQAIEIDTEIAKYKHARSIPITDRLRKEFYSYLVFFEPWNLCAPEQPTFPVAIDAGHLSTRSIQRMVNTASLAAIGRAVHPHMLRHTFATRLMKKTNIKIVQKLLGHVNLSTTEIYLHPDQEDLTKAIDGLNANGQTEEKT